MRYLLIASIIAALFVIAILGCGTKEETPQPYPVHDTTVVHDTLGHAGGPDTTHVHPHGKGH